MPCRGEPLVHFEREIGDWFRQAQEFEQELSSTFPHFRLYLQGLIVRNLKWRWIKIERRSPQNNFVITPLNAGEWRVMCRKTIARC